MKIERKTAMHKYIRTYVHTQYTHQDSHSESRGQGESSN